MDDIVERLRALHRFRFPNQPEFESAYAEAADEIERLRAIVERLPKTDRNDRDVVAARLAFAKLANERVWDAMEADHRVSPDRLWDNEGKNAKRAGLYSPKTYFRDAASGMRGLLRREGIVVAGSYRAVRPLVAVPKETP